MKLGDIAQKFQLDCGEAADVEITGIASLQNAGPGDLAFLFASSHRGQLATTKAAAVVLKEADAASCPVPWVAAENPRLAWARIASLFDPTPAPPQDERVHPSAVIAADANLGKDVSVGAGSVICSGAEIADGVAIGSGCHLGEGAIIGKGTRLFPRVVLYHGVHLGEACIVHSGVVIGADGFGYEFDGKDYVKIPQVYGVRVGSCVEIGAGTTIDRGGLNHTLIGDHCKLDNQVQVGHGTSIGHHTVISGCTAIAGSTFIGSYCLIGGSVGIVDNVKIADRVEITAMTLVSQSISKPGRYSSGTGLMPSTGWKRSVAVFKQLDGVLKRLRRLESSSGK